MAGAASSWLRRAGAALLFCGAICAHAATTQQPMTLSQIAARSVAAKYGNADPLWRIGGSVTATTPLGSALVTTAAKGPSPITGEVIDVTVKRVLPWSSLARGVARAAPLVGTAIAVAEMLDALRCREGFVGLECDLGVVEEEVSGYCENDNTMAGLTSRNVCATTQADLCLAVMGALVGGGYAWGFPARPPSSCTVYSPTQLRFVNVNGNIVYVGYYSAPVTRCPASIDASNPANNVPAGLPPGADGKCKTGRYNGQTEDQVTARGDAYGDKARAAAIAADLLGHGVPVEHGPAGVTPDLPSLQGGRELTTHPDGSTTVRDTRYELQPGADGYSWTPKVTVRDYAPGEPIPPPGDVTDGTTTEGSTPKEDPITCGLPNTPPCKIDESGTPTAPADDSATKAQGAVAAVTACVTSPSSCLPALPSLNWSFSLPTSCQPIPVAAFAKWGFDQVDICPYQPMIHDIMSLVWAAGGLFAAVGMMFKGSE